MSTETVSAETSIARAFAPLDKAALGVALGAVFAVLVAFGTVASMLMDPTQRFPLALLNQFFAGYEVTWPGALTGAAWGFFTGFCWGWFLAFARNLVLASWILSLRVRGDIATSREFLDHI